MLIATEVFLKFYQPFNFRLRNQKIVLDTNNSWTLILPDSDKLDEKSLVAKNNLGFRGSDPPEDFDQFLTLITVGGSTTESIVINEGKTWTDLLGEKLNTNFNRVWINNAGLDGHSTFGHLVLLKDYLVPIRPKYILFLIGINDLFLYEANIYDNFDSKKEEHSLLNNLLNKSELYILYRNFEKKQLSDKMNLDSTTVIDFNSFSLASNEHVVNFADLDEKDSVDNNDFLNIEQERKKEEYLQDFQLRLEEIINMARKNGIEPIFITQPAVYGFGIDGFTGIDLGKIPVHLWYEDFLSNDQQSKLTGEKQWQFLEEYNQVTREISEKKDVFVIDLANKMEKNTRYYYDYIHFSNEGSERVGEIIYKELCPYLWERESNFFRQQSCN